MLDLAMLMRLERIDSLVDEGQGTMWVGMTMNVSILLKCCELWRRMFVDGGEEWWWDGGSLPGGAVRQRPGRG